MDKIYLILTATDSEERLEEFYRTVPFPMLQTLAGVCYLLNDAGDERDDRGVSAFKSAITLLKHECDLEIRKLTKQRMMFSMLEYLPLAPLPFIGVLKWFFTTYMPGTSVIYNGMIGYISQTLIILLAIFAYWYITSTNSPTAIRRNDRSDFVDAFLYWPPFQRILPNILPKKARTKLKIEKELKGALSSKDIKYIYASKVLAAGIAFVMTLTALTAFTFLAKEFTYDNIKTASFLGGSDMSVEDARKWHELDNSLLAQPKAPRERDLQDIIPSYFPDISAMDLKDQCNRIIQKYNNYHALSFHWWYVLIGLRPRGVRVVCAWYYAGPAEEDGSCRRRGGCAAASDDARYSPLYAPGYHGGPLLAGTAEPHLPDSNLLRLSRVPIRPRACSQPFEGQVLVA